MRAREFSIRTTPSASPSCAGATSFGTAERGVDSHADDWHRQARCRGMPAETFYTDDYHRGRRRLDHVDHAKRICGSCPVQSRCREYAIRTQEPYGIWGGTTPRERVALLRSAQTATSSAS
jgi:Transcription factor WhiB